MSNKVRAVYEALEMRKTKQALKLLVPLLEKKPDSAQLKILKALALLRSGKTDDAMKLAKELKKHREVEGDETLMGNLAMFFREACTMNEATDLFVSAWERQPANENVARSVFAAYGRERCFLKQQQMAQKLFKQFGSDVYSLWGIVATMLQVIDGAPVKLLALAEKQMAKRAEDGKVSSYEELQLYLEILTRQGKYKEAHEVVCGNLGGNYSSRIEMLQAQAKYLWKQERWGEAQAVYRELLTVDEGNVQGRDEWLHVRGVLDCIMAGRNLPTPASADGDAGALTVDAHRGKGKTLSEDDWKGIVAEGEGLVQYLYEHNGNKDTRTGLLLRLEMYTRIASLRDEPASGAHVSAAIDHVAAYFDKFGGKDVCAYDVVEYLRALPQDAYPALLVKLRPLAQHAEAARGSDGASAEFEKAWLKYTCMVKLERMLGGYAGMSMDATVQAVSGLVSAFTSCGKSLVRKEGYPADRTPSDDCCLVAARILLDRFWDERKEDFLFDAIVVANYGLKISPTNFQFKLLLVSLYGLVGAYKPMHAVFTQLDVKHILWDTLSHLIQPASWDWCATSKIKYFCEQEMRLDRDSRKDTPDYTFLAFKQGTFSKISELIKFESRLMNSMQLAASRADWVTLSVLEHIDNVAEAREFLAGMGGLSSQLITTDEAAEALYDNRDMTVEVTWDPVTCASRAALEGSPQRQATLKGQIKMSFSGPRLLKMMLQNEGGCSDLKALLADMQRWMVELAWVKIGGGEDLLICVDAGMKDMRRLASSGFIGDSYLSVLSWMACVHLGNVCLSIKEIVEGAKDVSKDVSKDVLKVAAERVVVEEGRLKAVLNTFLESLRKTWAVPADSKKSDAQLEGGQLRIGIQGLTSLCIRALPWGGLCLPVWAAHIGQVHADKKTAQEVVDSLNAAKAAVRGIKTTLTDFTAAALKILKFAESHHTPEYAQDHPEVLGVLEGAREEREELIKTVAESRSKSLKAVKDMLVAQQEVLKSATQR